MHQNLPKRRRTLILLTACVSIFMCTLDSSIVGIALPVISASFSVSIAQVQWIVSSYLLTITSLLLVFGKISDLYGKKILFAAGIAVFTMGSLFCGISSNFPMLVISRVIQAIGASVVMALVQGIVTSVFPAGERGKAFGAVAMAVATGSLVGPSLGGILVGTMGWPYIFLINMPFGIVGVLLTLWLMPETIVPSKKRAFDIKGAILFFISVVLLFLSLLWSQENMISPPASYTMLFLSMISFVLFIRHEKTHTYPLLNLKLFKSPIFSMGLLSAFLAFSAMFTYLFFMPFYLQNALSFDILKAGLLMSLYPITTACFAPLSGWLSDKISYKPLTILGLFLSTVSLIGIALLGVHAQLIPLALFIMLMGLGSATFQSPNNNSIMSTVSHEDFGVAGSMTALFRNLGMISGTTFSVMIFVFVTQTGIEDISGKSLDVDVFVVGFKTVFLCAAAVSFVAMLLNIVRGTSMKPKRESTTD